MLAAKDEDEREFNVRYFLAYKKQFNLKHVISGGAPNRKGNTSVPIPRLTYVYPQGSFTRPFKYFEGLSIGMKW